MEGNLHQQSPEDVHFHEIGAVDSIVDVVGVCIGLHLLDIRKVVASPLPLGRGFVRCQHGMLPLPAPATFRKAGHQDKKVVSAKLTWISLTLSTESA